MHRLCSLSLVALYLPICVFGAILDLSELHWTLKNQNGSIAIPATIPSQAHLDLLKAGIITEPLLGINGGSAFLSRSRSRSQKQPSFST